MEEGTMKGRENKIVQLMDLVLVDSLSFSCVCCCNCDVSIDCDKHVVM